MEKRVRSKTILMLSKNISFIVVFYSYLSSNVSLLITIFSASILVISLVTLCFLRKEKSSYELNVNGILEKAYPFSSAIAILIALWTIVSIFFINK